MKKEVTMKEKKVYEQARMDSILLSSKSSLLAASDGNSGSGGGEGPIHNDNATTLSGTLGRVNYNSGGNPFGN